MIVITEGTLNAPRALVKGRRAVVLLAGAPVEYTFHLRRSARMSQPRGSGSREPDRG
jgi:hypothetical protein